MYVWTAIVLAVCVTAVVLGWHAKGGTPDARCASARRAPDPYRGGDRHRDPRLPRRSRDDPRVGGGAGELPRFEQGLPPAGRRRRGARAARHPRDVVRCGVVDRSARRSRARRPGRDRDPSDHRAARRDELVLPPRLLDGLDPAPSQAPPRAVLHQWGAHRTGGAARVRPARLHLGLPRGLRGGRVPSEHPRQRSAPMSCSRGRCSGCSSRPRWVS